jgi:serine/threonine protein kinase
MSADQGDAGGQYNYGICLKNGEGVAKDLKEAARYYKMSADQGNAFGQDKYGICLGEGEGVDKELKEAARYFKMSADQGNKDARMSYERCQAALATNLPSRSLSDFDGLSKMEQLGTGLCGTVWKVEDRNTVKTLAVKCIKVVPDFDSAKFMRQWRSFLDLLSHPCIVRPIGWGLPNKECRKLRIVMEYMCNGSLENALVEVSEGCPPSFWTHENITVMIVGIIQGMIYVHSNDVVHGDLKPSNILLDDKYRIHICDFGKSALDICGIETTEVLGTFAYKAPETFEECDTTTKVDIFAFGLILYEILVGRSVFPKDATLVRICELHESGYRPIIPTSVCGAVANVIERCWARDPNDRPCFEEIFAMLEESGFPFFEDISSEVVAGFMSSVSG